MTSFYLNPQTLAAALLCAVLPGDKDRAAQPFSTSEYHRLRSALSAKNRALAALVDETSASNEIEFLAKEAWDADRVRRLLERVEEFAALFSPWSNNEGWLIGFEDDAYPVSWRERLREASPPLLWGRGSLEVFSRSGLAVVGSRNADSDALEFTAHLGALCADQNISVISGGARGVDQAAMSACLESDGYVVGLLADSLQKSSQSESNRAQIERGHLALASPFSPLAPFHVGNAMARNKLIYTLADAAMVVSSDAETGGTWSGALENLKQKWTPLIVRDGDAVPKGNKLLIRRGGIAFDPAKWQSNFDVSAWFERSTENNLSLFPE
jgi:predicted Rossmann fold nucleotide-binding protein DprA/Smf involved in DNA uptake